MRPRVELVATCGTGRIACATESPKSRQEALRSSGQASGTKSGSGNELKKVCAGEPFLCQGKAAPFEAQGKPFEAQGKPFEAQGKLAV